MDCRTSNMSRYSRLTLKTKKEPRIYFNALDPRKV